MIDVQSRGAEATLSAVVDEARDGRPCVITRHGRKEAVVLGVDEWQRLSDVPSFGRLLMAAPVEDGDVDLAIAGQENLRRGSVGPPV